MEILHCVETPHFVETKHVLCVFSFHWTKSFHFAWSFHVNFQVRDASRIARNHTAPAAATPKDHWDRTAGLVEA